MNEILGSPERNEVVNELMDAYGGHTEEVRSYLDEIYGVRPLAENETRVDRSTGYVMSLVRIKEHLLSDVKLYDLSTSGNLELMKSKVSSSDFIISFLDEINHVREEFIDTGDEGILEGGHFSDLLPELSSLLERNKYHMTENDTKVVGNLVEKFITEENQYSEYETYVILFKRMLDAYGDSDLVNVKNLTLVFKRLMIFICNQNKNPINMLFDPESEFAEEDKFGRIEVYVRIVAYVLEIASMMRSLY